jgi:hypothetical protein
MIKKLSLSLFLLFLPLLAFGASISTLTDNFNDNSIDAAKWTNDDPTQIVEINNDLELTSIQAGTGWTNLWSKSSYDFTGSSVSIKVVDAGNQSLASWIFVPLLIADTGDTNEKYWLIKAGSIETSQGDYDTAYDANVHRYLRIREASGTIYWDSSTDGITWTNRDSAVVGAFVLTDCNAVVQMHSTAEASTTTAKVDDFNILPSATRRIILIE